MGTIHIRTQIDVDAGVGLANWEGMLTTRETFKDRLAIQLIAFPQGGIRVCPESVELLEEAVRMGAVQHGGYAGSRAAAGLSLRLPPG